MQHLDQLRAKNAFVFIKSHIDKQDIINMAMRLPFMFHINGILATFAFLKKSKDKVEPLNANLIQHLIDSKRFEIGNGFSAENIFQGENAWVKEDKLKTEDFFIVTDEMIKYSNWLKRAAEALTQS